MHKDKNGGMHKERYGYNAAGYVEKVTEDGVLVAKYTYDGIGRLLREDNKALGKTAVFVYDGCGNILRKKIFSYSDEETEKLTNGTEIVYSYKNANRLDQLTAYGNETIVYSSYGMPQKYRGQTCA